MRYIAERQLLGDYGHVMPGAELELDEKAGESMRKQGLVRPATAPTVQYDTKVITPEHHEVSARDSFRSNVPVSDEKPAGLAAESDRVLSESDVLESRIADSSGRRGRTRSAAGG